MHLDLMRDPAKAFPKAEDPLAVTSMRVWHCKYKTLAPISRFKNLKTLVIATFPDLSFDVLGQLPMLEQLSVLHLPKITDIEFIGTFKNLKALELKTLPSWDSSRKRTLVPSLEPLAHLHELESLSLLGVVASDYSLSPLTRCTSLKTANFLGYPKTEVERFFQTSDVQRSGTSVEA